MAQKILIDADPGLGDAFAIAVALLDPELDVVGLTAVRSFLSPRQVFHNLQSIVATVDPKRWPRLAGPDMNGEEPGPAVPPPHLGRFRQLNGEFGLGDWKITPADPVHPRDASKLMIDLSKTHPHELVVLTLGPLTNVCLAAEKDPEFLDRLKGLVCLGGAVESPGDVTPAAEFNMLADPESARVVLHSPSLKTLVPLDVSSRVTLSFQHLDRLKLPDHGPVGEFVRAILSYALRTHHQFLGLEALRLHELVALAAVAQPKLFEKSSLACDVETEGRLTRGMTVFDRRANPEWRANLEVVREVDAQGVLDYLDHVFRVSTVFPNE